MRLSILCKAGKIQLTDDDILRVRTPLGTIWQVPASDVTGFSSQPGTTVGWITALNVTIQARTGSYTAETVTKANFEKLQAAFPHLQTQVAAGKEWYYNPAALTHVATYTNERQMQREMELAYQHGWQVQGQSAQGGRSSAGKVIGGALIAGPLGALAGAASKSKDKTTITYVRTPEWLAQHQQK